MNEQDGERKVTLTIYTTPVELRALAADLERSEEVRVNWYHTRVILRKEVKPMAQPPEGKG